ncbi:MAG: hypothetical protein IJ088_06570 [Clostridia bacterium]|nr:hypothetical protein [Clostridia bacterium]
MKIGEKYVQFSKIMVLIVLTAVTLLAALGLVGMVLSAEYERMSELFSHYTDFSAVVFVAYSGNSVAEKWIVSGHPEKNGEEACG